MADQQVGDTRGPRPGAELGRAPGLGHPSAERVVLEQVVADVGPLQVIRVPSHVDEPDRGMGRQRLVDEPVVWIVVEATAEVRVARLGPQRHAERVVADEPGQDHQLASQRGHQQGAGQHPRVVRQCCGGAGDGESPERRRGEQIAEHLGRERPPGEEPRPSGRRDAELGVELTAPERERDQRRAGEEGGAADALPFQRHFPPPHQREPHRQQQVIERALGVAAVLGVEGLEQDGARLVPAECLARPQPREEREERAAGEEPRAEIPRASDQDSQGERGEAGGGEPHPLPLSVGPARAE